MLRKWLTTALEVTGMALIVGGIWEFSSIAGAIAAGVALLVVGNRLA